MAKDWHSCRLFLELYLFPHTTSQDSCRSWSIGVQVIICALLMGLEKNALFQAKPRLVVQTIVYFFKLISCTKNAI